MGDVLFYLTLCISLYFLNSTIISLSPCHFFYFVSYNVCCVYVCCNNVQETKKALVGADMTHNMYFTSLQKHWLLLQLTIIAYIVLFFMFFNASHKSPRLYYYKGNNVVLWHWTKPNQVCDFWWLNQACQRKLTGLQWIIVYSFLAPLLQ